MLKKSVLVPLLALACAALAAAPASAQGDASPFRAGPVFEEFGLHAPVDADMAIPEGTIFKVMFEAVRQDTEGRRNGEIEIAARFINMSVAAGVPLEKVHVAIVVRGPASNDLLTDAAWGKTHDGQANPNAGLVRALLDHGVRIILCGQSAAGLGITKDQLQPGVEIAQSAITARALLQMQGYTKN
ncbi:MAG: DsrE family protein [Sphingomonadales bacterium]|nr:DsrE family protein [Sphingomonadales bacterium]MBD3772941.1 DsrE family protein [Paracoccaceae bacterium]